MKRLIIREQFSLQIFFMVFFLFFIQNFAFSGDFVHLNTTPAVLHTASITGTPVDVATDASGHIIVITSDGNLYSLSVTGAIIATATLTGAGSPVAVTMDDVGDIYVAKGNGTVYRLNTSLSILVTQTFSETLVDISVNNVGNVYIAAGSGKIYKRTLSLASLTDITLAGTPTAITANSLGSLAGDIYVATSGGTVYRLNTSLVSLASGTLSGTPVDVAGDDAGDIIVAMSGGVLYRINPNITVAANLTLPGPLVEVDLDDAGDIVTANQSGTVFITNTGLSSYRSVSSGVSLSAVSINLVGDIIGVGGTGTPLVAAATFSTSSLPFGTVARGTSSTLPFTVTSNGTAPLTISSVSISSSAPAGVWSILPAVPPAITFTSPPKTFNVTLNVPAGITSDVSYNANITVVTNDPGNLSKVITATGTGHIPVPKACYSVTSIPFSQQNAGSSIIKYFDLQNCGDADLIIQNITLSTTSPAGVWSINPSVPPIITLAPRASRRFNVTFNVPSTITGDVSYSGTFNVTTNDPSNSVQPVTVGGTGHVPIAHINIPPEYFVIDYRNVELGFQFSRPLLIQNTGDLALTLQVSYLDPSDPDLPHFQLETSGGSFTIPPYSEHIFKQTFQPTSIGSKDLIIVIHNTNDATFTSQNITLQGVGTPPVPIDVAMVLDRSGSMAETAGEIIKIEALRRSGKLFTELLRDGTDYLGITQYNHTNQTIVNLGPIASVRSTAQTLISGLQPDGRTCIGGAMRTASVQFTLSPDASHKKVMIVLTDGNENEPPSINDILNGYDSYAGLFVEYPTLLTYSIGLGLETNINADRLQAISNRGAGGFYLVTGNLEGLSVFNLENYYFKVFADAIGQSIIVDPTFSVGLNETLEVPIGIITEDREALFFFIGELPQQAYIFELVDPQNNVMTSSSSIGGMSVQVKKIDDWMFFRVKFPPPDVNTDYVGMWKFKVRIDNPQKWTEKSATLTHVVNQQSGQFGVSGTHRMSFLASVASNYRLAASLQPGVVLVGEPIRMRAALTDGGWPSTQGSISVTISRPDGSVHFEMLYDDGLHGDDNPHDGIFSGTYTRTTPSGVYQFLFSSTGITERGESVRRQEIRSQFVGTPGSDPKEPACLPCNLLRMFFYAFLLLLLAIIIVLWRIYRRR
jgi:hypothetical protein